MSAILSTHSLFDGRVVVTRFRSTILGEVHTTWFADFTCAKSSAIEDNIAQGDRSTVVRFIRKLRDEVNAEAEAE